jgi:hypothetical protein
MQRNAASFMRFDASYRESQRPALRGNLHCSGGAIGGGAVGKVNQK